MRTLVETIASVDDILEFIEKHDLDHDVLRARDISVNPSPARVSAS